MGVAATEESIILGIFTEPPEMGSALYTAKTVSRETAAWWDIPEDNYQYYDAGRVADGAKYRRVEPLRLVIIGDHGVDRPIALDYGASI
jgi:hypothetical protein